PAMHSAAAYTPSVDGGIIMYDQPVNKSAAVALLETGARVSATGEEQDGFMRVEGGGVVGWVDKQLLKKAGNEKVVAAQARRVIFKMTRPTLAMAKPMPKKEIVTPINTDGRVVLYSASWCPFCDKARDYFQRTGVPFDEYDMEKHPKGRRDYEAMNGDGIPIVLVNNQKIVGWKQREFERHYGVASAAAEVQPVPAPAPVVQVARAAAATARIVSSEAGPAYAPKLASGVIVYMQPTNRSQVGGIIKGSDQVTAMGEEQNGYIRVQGVVGNGWVDKSLMKKL
ncbi:MAG: glutaredoxin family protein, partial [Burkholderiales bacterium]